MELGKLGRRPTPSGKRQRLEYRFNHLTEKEVDQMDFAQLVEAGPMLNLKGLTDKEISTLCGIFAVEHRRRKDEKKRKELEKGNYYCEKCRKHFKAEEPEATIPVAVVRCPDCGNICDKAEEVKT